MNHMFHKASLRLAALYLIIMMAISLFFSAALYQVSMQELYRGLREPGPETTFSNSHDDDTSFSDTFSNTWLQQLQQERLDYYKEAKIRLLQRLAIINAVILVGGGFLSYYLAKRTLQPIEEAHEAQSRFTADASHELRTPIAAMQSEIEVALMNPKLSLKEAKAQLGSNLEELEKLTALSEGLLRLARLKHGELSKQVMQVETIISDAVQQVLPLAEKKRILITQASIPDVTIIGDQASLTEVLVKLLENAVKYSPEKSKITVDASTEHKQVAITVKDQGFGIAPKELPHIFERFYRADTARSKQQTQGYGLGLAIAKDIVELHEGTIMATSKPGKGSKFTIKLPLAT